jgi:hypothetical protein
MPPGATSSGKYGGRRNRGEGPFESALWSECGLRREDDRGRRQDDSVRDDSAFEVRHADGDESRDEHSRDEGFRRGAEFDEAGADEEDCDRRRKTPRREGFVDSTRFRSRTQL